MVVVIFLDLLLVVLLASALKQAVLFGREVDLELEKGIDDFVDVLVNADQVVLYEVSLAEFDPLFAFLLFALKLIDIIDIMILLVAFFRLASRQF